MLARSNGRHLLTAPLLALLITSIASGCKSDAESGATGTGADANTPTTAQANHEMRSWIADLPVGDSSLDIRGTVTGTGEYTTAEDPRYSGVSHDVFRPARGGGNARRGSNADGPFSITLYTDARHADEPDNTVRAWVTLVLPPNAQAGRSYHVASFNDADDTQVQAHVQGDGRAWSFSRQVEGELYLDELGEQASLAWRLKAADGRGEQARWVNVEGAARALPLTRQSEAEYDITINGERTDSLSRISGRVSGDSRMMMIGNGIYLYLPLDLSPGDHPITAERSADAIRAQFTRHDVDAATGTLQLTENAGRFDATIALEGQGEDHISLAGDLRWFVIEGD